MDSTSVSYLIEAAEYAALITFIILILYLIIDSILYRVKDKPRQTEPGTWVRLPREDWIGL